MAEKTETQKKIYDWGIISKYRTALMGVATILVLLLHANEYQWPSHLGFVLKLISVGSTGVEIFLFLSGIGLYYSIKKNPDILNFYKRRFERIVPIYLLIDVPLYALIFFILKSGNFFDYLLHVSSFSYWYPSRSWSDVWYVSFIIPLYLIYPFIYLLMQKNKKSFIPLLIISFAVKVLLIYCNPVYYEQIELAVSRLPIFIIGCYCGLFVYNKKELTAKKSIIITAISLFCFLLIRLSNIMFTDKNSFVYGSVVRISNIFLTFFIVFVCCFLFNLLTLNEKSDGGGRNLLIFDFFGKYSLEVYLTHRLLSYIYIFSPLYKSYPQFWIYYLIIVPISILTAVLFRKLLTLLTCCFIRKKE